MENYNIKDLLKASQVKRWHTVDTVKSQSLAEHQWNVCMISESLVLSMGLSGTVRTLIARYALIHDINEIWTGDIPSPEKERLKRLSVSTGDTHNAPRGRYTGSASACEDGPPVDTGGMSGIVATVVRAADLIDACWWSSKYVLDEWVVEDCRIRLDKFMIKCTPKLGVAIKRIITEII